MSDFYNKYPYTDFHELNLDWVLERVKKLTEDWLATHEEWEGVQQDWADTEQAWIDFKAYVENYLANLDVQDEIDNKINAMILDGSFETIIRPTVISQTTAATEAWLAAHITQPTTPVIDNTLSIAGAGADSQVVGYDIAPWYSASNTYNAGDIVLYNGFIYRCKIDITVAEAWDASKWQLIRIMPYANQSFMPRYVPSGTSTLASLRLEGVYHIETAEAANITDFPSGVTPALSTLINITNAYSSGGFIYQYLLFLNNDRYQRLIQTNGTVYQNWRKLNEVHDKTLSIANANADAEMVGYDIAPWYSASSTYNAGDIVLYNGFIYRCKIDITVAEAWDASKWQLIRIMPYANQSFMPRYVPSGTTTLASIRLEGVYHLESAEMANITDLPSGSNTAQTSTLINITNAYSGGGFTYQYFLQLSGYIWKRLIIASDGSTWFDWDRVDATKDFLQGKKLVTAGDSYTRASFTGAYSDYDGKNFGHYIAARNKMQFVNSGIDGSTMALPSDSDPNRNPFSDTRYTAIPADTDYLTIWFGINDSAHCDLGTIDDATNTTFYGAWNVVLSYYLTNRPFMKVLLVVTTGATAEFRQAVRDVAQKWGYPYLDWEKDVQIPAFFDREGMSDTAKALRRDAFGYNGPVPAHPNPEWHEYASTIFETKLRSI